MKRYVLDQTRLDAPGVYEYRTIEEAEVRGWLHNSGWIPCCEDAEVRHHLWTGLGRIEFEPREDRAPCYGAVLLEAGDEALIVRRDPTKSSVVWEYGILRRRA